MQPDTTCRIARDVHNLVALKEASGRLEQVDDIIQTRYPLAPSIRAYVEKTDNSDDERFAVYKWQRKIWFLMNTEKRINNMKKKQLE